MEIFFVLYKIRTSENIRNKKNHLKTIVRNISKKYLKCGFECSIIVSIILFEYFYKTDFGLVQVRQA